MIDESTLRFLEEHAGVFTSAPEIHNGLRELVRFYRRMRDRRLVDVLKLEQKVAGLFRRLAHGSGPHRLWLLEELERYFPGVRQQGPTCLSCFDSGEIKKTQWEPPVACPACRPVLNCRTPKRETDEAIAEFRGAPDGDGDAD